MNQTIRQSQAILQGLRLQTSLATTEMYQRIGRDEPARILNYTVVPRGGVRACCYHFFLTCSRSES